MDKRLHEIMHSIHTQCVRYGEREDGSINYVRGANVAGFMKRGQGNDGAGNSLMCYCKAIPGRPIYIRYNDAALASIF